MKEDIKLIELIKIKFKKPCARVATCWDLTRRHLHWEIPTLTFKMISENVQYLISQIWNEVTNQKSSHSNEIKRADCPSDERRKYDSCVTHALLILIDSLFIWTMRLIIWQKFKVKSTICKDHDIKLVSLRIEETTVREALVGFQMLYTNQI